jgi:predicted Ser/Thr protein kinase
VTREQWERLKVLFSGALDQPAERRREWLTLHAQGDEALAREAGALVLAHDTAGDFLEDPAMIDPADLAAVDEFPSGTRIGSYEIEHEIGRGGMGVVYLARDLRLGRRVALKALPRLHDSNAALRERLRREARAAANISHAAIATVYALEEVDGRLFIASEYIEGHSLRSEIESGALERTRAIAIAVDIVSALCAAHDAGVIHRDLKPENVLIASTGGVKVVDFGIAHIDTINTRLTREGDVIGTPAYMAPEQLIGAAVDARADIYAAGVLLTEMLTGHHPLAPGRRSMPVSVSEIAWRCIQTDPNARYRSARELLAALERELANSNSVVEAVAPADAAASRPRWWWEFHQAAVSIVYAVMIWPTWLARNVIGGQEGNAVFVAVLAAAIVSVTLRLHLWFTSRFYPAELGWTRSRATVWMLVSDAIFAIGLVVAGVLVGDARPVLAVIEIAVAVGAAAAFAVVEPATTRAAFGQADRL